MTSGGAGPVERVERARYEDVWGALDAYGDDSPGEWYAPVFLEHVSAPGLVLDAGCGSGKGAVALARAGFEVVMTDLTADGLGDEARALMAGGGPLRFREGCLWRPMRGQIGVGAVDAVFCCDVLEHLPTQFTMLAVDQMLALARRGVFLSIALGRDSASEWIGEALHLTVQPFRWWLDSLRELGRVEDARDLMKTGLYWVTR